MVSPDMSSVNINRNHSSEYQNMKGELKIGGVWRLES